MDYCFEAEIRRHPAYESHVTLATIDAEAMLEGHGPLDDCSALMGLEVSVAVVVFKECHPDYHGGRWLVFGDRDDACSWLDAPLGDDEEPCLDEARELIEGALLLLA